MEKAAYVPRQWEFQFETENAITDRGFVQGRTFQPFGYYCLQKFEGESFYVTHDKLWDIRVQIPFRFIGPSEHEWFALSYNGGIPLYKGHAPTESTEEMHRHRFMHDGQWMTFSLRITEWVS